LDDDYFSGEKFPGPCGVEMKIRKNLGEDITKALAICSTCKTIHI
jgi:hypothetical protein